VPVSVCVAVTVAPGSTPPCASVIVPVMFPVVTVCAPAGIAASAKQNATARLHTAFVRNFISSSPRAVLVGTGKGRSKYSRSAVTLTKKRPPWERPLESNYLDDDFTAGAGFRVYCGL